MKKQFLNYIILLLILELLKAKPDQRSILYFPFHLKQLKYNPNYNSTNFLNDYYKREINIHLKIGNPIQNVNALIDDKSESITAKEDLSGNYMNNNNYFPDKSSSMIYQKSRAIFEEINFEEKNESLILKIETDNYKRNNNKSYILTFGLLIHFLISEFSPNFILKLKKKNIINKLIWTINYNNSDEGDFIVGGNLTEYNDVKYPISNYYTIYMTLTNFIVFDSVYIENKSKYYLNSTNTVININSGFIIGPKEYKNLIDKIYFNDLINKNICELDADSYLFNNNPNKHFHYYIYNCQDKHFKNYYNKFPKLLFSSKALNYNFEFTQHDLFIHINDKFYFLVTFLKDTLKKDEIWYLGEPFYKKYTFTMNLEAKTIGFYIDKNREFEKNHNNVNNNNFGKNTSTFIKIIILIVELAILISLIITAIILALRIKERKKRLNEIKDENYEYLEEHLTIN